MKNLKSVLKNSLPHVGVILFFFVIVFIYFYPVFEGKVIQQTDIIKHTGMVQELREYGKPSGWVGSMFSGMPSYQVSAYSEGVNFMEKVKTFIVQILDPKSAGPIFFMLIFSYILFLVLGASIPLSVLGALAIAFSSYNFIIIDAGHVTKVWTLACTPLIFAGMYAIFKKQYLLGFIIFVFGLYLQVSMNHLQITYYVALFCGVFFIAFLWYCIKKKDFRHLGISCGLWGLALAFVVSINIVNLYETNELSKESIRGKAELAPVEASNQAVSSGLDRDYAFAWSYGKAESFTFLIPDLMGGVSKGLGEDSEVYKALVSKARAGEINGEMANSLLSHTSQYWGDQPFTSGPVYLGAIVCLLFIFSLFIVKNNIKWWLFGVTVFFVLLSWGRNLSWFNDFMFYHFPYYNKFRAVSMALVIPAFTFPILSILGLKELFSGNQAVDKLKKALLCSVGIVGGICLILWLVPGIFFDFHTAQEAQPGIPGWFLNALESDRKGLLQADAIRSLVFVLFAGGLIFWYIKSAKAKNAVLLVSIALIVLSLIDMWQIDKRYLNENNFVASSTYKNQMFKKSVADEAILKDQTPSYRVLNLNNPFQETFTSYYHKSVGGYNAAKLRRYQDLIDRRLGGEINSIIGVLTNNPTEAAVQEALEQCPSLNMLNTKYIIYNPAQPPLYNPAHYGTSWFVDSYKFVDDADMEMAALSTLNPLQEVVLDKKFSENIGNLQLSPDSSAFIEMTAYAPDRVKYRSSSSHDGLAVFSEVYYPYGWKAYIDGKEIPISRADWTLRALVVPSGQHEIEMVFDHQGIKLCSKIATVSSGVLLVLLIGLLIYLLFRKEKKHANES